ncbi:L,D-transpeptidase family protein [Anaeromicrobium sediminis]|uniref:L,D-TPase catalytic domain-containing protein n=1 Tax=Anaeromicrobium sediminis TaxID=1478221 RepID=A0A267MLK3_9FIRM|nr:L,D-transpeptidase family protein [Anaeromicrobium sediminis]PAB59683.1 hypothetical protein CCE28_08950 [Anaeromicrobium sediminis]
MNKKIYIALSLIIVLGLGTYLCGRSLWVPVYSKVAGRRTVEEVINKIKPENEQKLISYFEKKQAIYVPEKIALIGLKEEKILELWALSHGKWTFIHKYDILAASGQSGPKLKEGDKQVPEGIYRIEGLNPNSSYHLSMKVNYPNEFDMKKAKEDNRQNLGGNIFIHGKAASIGCIAIGDEAIEEVFLLVNEVGKENVEVVIAPMDLRNKDMDLSKVQVSWYKELHDRVKIELNKFR